MKKIFIPIALSVLISSCGAISQIKNTVENTAMGKVNDKASQSTSTAMDTMLGNGNHNGSATNNGGNNSGGTSAPSAVGMAVNSPQSIAAYQNYDFKPGDTIIFSDDFTADQDGEFPAHWNLDAGQGVVNAVQGTPAFCLTEGNYVMVDPRMTTSNYLTDPFTVEFDYLANGGYAPMIRFVDDKTENRDLHFGHSVSTSYFPKDFSGNSVGSDADYDGKWHHAAVIYKNGQIKAYLDNTRALVVPQCGFVPVNLRVGGIGGEDKPITFKNVRIASGGSANAIGNILTNGKFVTHGITFDIGKATLLPQSMGVLNDVSKFLKANPSINMEIDGHTDNTGAAAKNLTLSQQRANAVEAQLITMGIDASRLTTKGFGSTVPIASNDTPEGQANNRRVEFIKL
jgi:outer membrane protein OmpA-like peptidoglycan-associated protein